jgi:hypothetical protein
VTLELKAWRDARKAANAWIDGVAAAIGGTKAMTFKIEDFSVGDRVTLKEGVVTAVRQYSGPYPVSIRIGIEDGPSSFALSSIATHTPAPRPFKVGDPVTWAFGAVNGEFKGTHGHFAFIGLDHGNARVIPVSHLRHADPAPAPQEAPAAHASRMLPPGAVQAERFWMVHGNGPSSYRHESREAAENEARRLAERNTGTTFYVLEAVGAALMGAVERAVEIVEPRPDVSAKTRYCRESDISF